MTETEEKRAQIIQQLLAQAESTPYPEEAKTFSSKAQQLMLKWSIDDAMLAGLGKAESLDIDGLEIKVDANEYFHPKINLLDTIARFNSCRTMYYSTNRYEPDETKKSGRRRYKKVIVYGTTRDREWVRTLWLSLLIQAETEFASEDVQQIMKRDRSVVCDTPQQYGGFRISYHNTFIRGFTNGVWEQLSTAKKRAESEAKQEYGEQSVALVVVNRDKAVDNFMEQEHPNLTSSKSRAGRNGGNASAAGFAAGKRANVTRKDKITGKQRRLING